MSLCTTWLHPCTCHTTPPSPKSYTKVHSPAHLNPLSCYLQPALFIYGIPAFVVARGRARFVTLSWLRVYSIRVVIVKSQVSIVDLFGFRAVICFFDTATNNERTNEQTNERTNERTNVRTTTTTTTTADNNCLRVRVACRELTTNSVLTVGGEC